MELVYSYTYLDFVEVFYQRDIAGCKKIGDYLLRQISKTAKDPEVSQPICTRLLFRLHDLPEVYDDSVAAVLETVKFVLKYYN